MYDGRALSDFGFIICSFEGSSGAAKADTGSEITFTTSPINDGKRVITGGTKYGKCLSTTFQICKDPEAFRESEMEIGSEEFRALSRWLNRRQFLWFKASDWCEPEKARPWVRASFTLSRIDVGGTTVGIELSMKTDSPFCYGDEIVKEFTFAAAGDSIHFKDENDEIGETIPALVVTCGESGDLVLEDDVTGCACTVENCTGGEILTFSGDTKIIETSSVTHDIANDFNYDFFRFGNTYDNRDNYITASIPCTVEMRYRPIYKDTL